MAQTIGGRRLVPIEIGRSYTDEGWGQQIVTFGHFMREYLLPPSTSSPSCSESSNNHETVALNGAETERPVDTVTNEHYDSAKIAYLAQHDLLTQLPSLRADILIPDYCFSSPPPPIPTHAPLPSAEELDTPLQNAWLGPPGTVSPLHTDPYHNILCQVVGYKYVRLYPPSATARLHPRGVREEGDGVDMSNTSSVDLDEALEVLAQQKEEGHSDARKRFDERFPGFAGAEFVEAVLGPGECLYIPVGWWHYVRSLSTSFSVSFWFD